MSRSFDRSFSHLITLAALAAPALTACVPVPPKEPAQEAAPPAAAGPVARFSWPTLDGAELSTASIAGRITVLGFITTYDLASQAEARHLANLLHHHAPRLNVAIVVLEPQENAPLAQAFASALGLGLPIAFADAATIAGQGPFAGLHHVPSVVILDRGGREAWRHIGMVDEPELDKAVRAVEKLEKGAAP